MTKKKDTAKTEQAPQGRKRKTEIDADVQKLIVEAITAGATYELAAQCGGISYATFYNWMRRGEAEEEPYFDFFKAIKDAEGKGVIELLNNIRTAAKDPTKWQAAAWILERRYPEQYGRTRHELTGANGGPIQTDNAHHGRSIDALAETFRKLDTWKAQRAETNRDIPLDEREGGDAS